MAGDDDPVGSGEIYARADMQVSRPRRWLIARFITMFAIARRWRHTVERGMLRVDARGLWLDGRLVARRDQLRVGYLATTSGGPRVRLPAEALASLGEASEIAVEREGEGRALLRALRLDPGHAKARFRAFLGGQQRLRWLPWVFGPFMFVFAGLLLTRAGPLPLVGLVLGTFFLVGLVVMALTWPVDIEVGADGVLVANRLRRTFFGFASMSDVLVDAGDVAVCMTDGRRVHLGVNHRGRLERALGNEWEEYLQAMAARIREGLAAHRQGGPPPDVAALVARGGRTTEAWLRALAHIPDTLAAFRSAAVPEEQLWCIVENPSLDEALRAGAAVALRGQLDAEKRARLRVAAATSVSPRLRVALERAELASDDDAAALEDALDALDPMPPAKAAR